ncbi:cupin domain-containing protein [Uliginosibacterium paludis]|uniref:Cupin domain-containing protein n=1 Tax=Uliginosibacterium paludis TaxID=1615952 RepID=A0ABV2CNE3_9RHOO
MSEARSGGLSLLRDLPPAGFEEHFLTLLERPGLRIERIVSDGQVSPPGFWYEQAEDEWVLLLQGTAELEYRDDTRIMLTAGDSLLIPAGCAHRVAQTASRTVWLALFFPPA